VAREGQAMVTLGARVVKFGGDTVSGSGFDTWHWTNPQSDGQPCNLDGQCASGFCVDGVCCASACGGNVSNDCQACSLAAGASADGVCTVLPATARCRTASCIGNTAIQEAFCDGTSASCPPENRQSCTSGTVCMAGACVPGAGEDGGVTDGGVTDGGVTDGGVADGGSGPTVGGLAPLQAECGRAYRFQPVVQGEGPFRYALVEGPEGMTVDAATGLVEWVPLKAQAGSHTFTLRVEDAHGATDWRGTVDVTCETKSYRVGCDCSTGLPVPEAVWLALLLAAGTHRRRLQRP
jgi:MYXO-CTERM domain-containing protein